MPREDGPIMIEPPMPGNKIPEEIVNMFVTGKMPEPEGKTRSNLISYDSDSGEEEPAAIEEKQIDFEELD